MEMISTTELGHRLGIALPSSEVARIAGISPVRHTKGIAGLYWREQDVPAIAASLAAHFLRIAGNAVRPPTSDAQSRLEEKMQLHHSRYLGAFRFTTT